MATIGLRRPREQAVAAGPAVGDPLPVAATLPRSQRDFRLVAFLRHVGCPFAEATVKELRDLGDRDPRVEVVFVSHGDAGTTSAWLREIGGCGSARWIDDPSREAYGRCGLGYSGAAHFLGLASLGGAIALRRRGIRNRVASGTRWQRAGAFLVDREGLVRWRHVPVTADLLPTSAEILVEIGRATER